DGARREARDAAARSWEPLLRGAPAETARRRAARPATPDRPRARADLGEDVREAIDVCGSPTLGDRDEQDVVHALVVAAEDVPGMHTALACALDDLARRDRS